MKRLNSNRKNLNKNAFQYDAYHPLYFMFRWLDVWLDVSTYPSPRYTYLPRYTYPLWYAYPTEYTFCPVYTYPPPEGTWY